MPNALVKSFADKTGKSVEQVEKMWDEAKAIAVEDKGIEDYPYIVGILKKKLGIEEAIMKKDLYSKFLNSKKSAKEFINEAVNVKEKVEDMIPPEKDGVYIFNIDDSEYSGADHPFNDFDSAKDFRKSNLAKSGNYQYIKIKAGKIVQKIDEDGGPQVSTSLGNVSSSPVGINPPTKDKEDIYTKAAMKDENIMSEKDVDENLYGKVNPEMVSTSDISYRKGGVEKTDLGGNAGRSDEQPPAFSGVEKLTDDETPAMKSTDIKDVVVDDKEKEPKEEQY